MGVKSRARGDREPAGRAKAAILLYLAESGGERTFTELREHMLEHHNIRSQKDIRIHLNDLSDDARFGLVAKQSNGNGNACSYRIRDGFCRLSKLYNYLKDHDLGAELMRTRHFREYTASCDFFINVKVHLLCDVMLDLDRCIASDEGTAAIRKTLDHVPPDDQDLLLAWMSCVRHHDLSNPLSRHFTGMINAINSPTAEAAGDAFAQLIMDRGRLVISPEHFDMLASDILIPDEYRERITAIMRLSPGAFDCIANLNCDNPLFIRNPFLSYVISLLLAQGETISDPCLTLVQCSEYAAGIPRLAEEPPIFTIARSHFITDLAGGRLAVKDVPAETLRLIFGVRQYPG